MKETKNMFIFSTITFVVGLFSVFITITIYKAYFDENSNAANRHQTANKTGITSGSVSKMETTKLSRNTESSSETQNISVPRAKEAEYQATNQSGSENSAKYSEDIKSIIDETNRYISGEKYDEVIQKKLNYELKTFFKVKGLTSSQNADLKGTIVKLDYFGRTMSLSASTKKKDDQVIDALSKTNEYLSGTYDVSTNKKHTVELKSLLSKKPNQKQKEQINDALRNLATFEKSNKIDSK